MSEPRPVPSFTVPEVWPPPADTAAAARLVERFAALGRTEQRLATNGAVAALLRCLGGNSPYLADLVLAEAATLRLYLQHGPEEPVRRALASVASCPAGASRATVAATLRRAKRVVALATALADIGGTWNLARVTGTLSAFAEAALGAAVAHLLAAGQASGALRLPHPDDPERDCGFTVLGMGKLGGGELNYSSDIDLVLLYDPEAGVYHGDSAGTFYTRMARDLVALMEARDVNGYVFRTDLRLRPDPAATPPCISLPAALSYYESMGENWERAAMLKARPVAGDRALGTTFLEAIRPFIWHRQLDFAALADIGAIKRRIDAQRRRPAGGSGPERIAGINVKLGPGGIREIEFLAQTLQLVWGGHEPALRSRRTLEALAALVRAGHLPRRTAAELAAAYKFLRRVEHRLQMVADRQTHTLPDRREGLEAFARFLGQGDAAEFAARLQQHLDHVARRYLEVFAAVPDPFGEAGASPLDFSGSGEPPPATVEALAALGYAAPAHVVEVVRSWAVGRPRALRSERARTLLHAVLPGLLTALARTGQPDLVFARFDALLNRLPTGVQPLSLFQHNPALLDRVAGVLGAAPSLAEYLAATPAALEGLIHPDETADVSRALRRRLADARDLEDAIDIIRRAVRAEDFSLSVASMEGRLEADAAGKARANLADAALDALLGRVEADFASRFGRVRGGGLAVVLLGKAGSREMMAGSDLDLMLVYDHPAGVSRSTGAHPLPASQWFLRAVHAFVAALTAPDALGPLYSVDMRLRPSGNKGPVAVSLASFERYHATSAEQGGAWTWERMALTRARAVAGPPRLRARVAAAIRTALENAGPPERIRADAAAMRARLARELPPSGPWDVKLRPGGQIEVEFIAQVLQLVHARAHPEVLHPGTRHALAALRDAGLLDAADAALLIRADHTNRTLQGLLRIAYGHAPATSLPAAAMAALSRLAGSTAPAAPLDADAVGAILQEQARRVRAAFIRLVGEIET
jgi:glutamate-ammonia-ligase adenylyltransferase